MALLYTSKTPSTRPFHFYFYVLCPYILIVRGFKNESGSEPQNA